MSQRIFTPAEIEHIILMAWADTVSFETIQREYNLNYDEVRHFMKTHQSPKTYVRWRKRIESRSQTKSKHEALETISSRRLKLNI